MKSSNIYPFRGDDFKTLAKLCYPKITVKEAEKAFNALEKMGMIQKNPYGYYEQVDSILTTGDDWSSQAIVNFQLNTMDLAKNALNNCPRPERDISTLTLSISADELKQIKDKLGNVQREILEIAKNAKKSDRVYQMNFQVFPLSSKPEEGA